MRRTGQGRSDFRSAGLRLPARGVVVQERPGPKSCLTPLSQGVAADLFGRHFSSGAAFIRRGLAAWSLRWAWREARWSRRWVRAPTATWCSRIRSGLPQHQLRSRRETADAKIGAVMNDGSTDLKEFRSAGGKLILWHGWSDPLISPLHTIAYYNKLATQFAASGAAHAAASRRWQISRACSWPGCDSLRGRSGPDTFDSVGRWRRGSSRQGPDSMIATHNTAGRRTARGRCAPIRTRPSTTGRATATTPRASVAVSPRPLGDGSRGTDFLGIW